MADERVDPRLIALTNLVQIESDARRAETVDDLAYIIVNDSRRLVSYRQAFLWQESASGGFSLSHASNTSQLDRDAPLVRWLDQVPERLLPDLVDDSGWSCVASDLADEDSTVWRGSLAPHLLVLPVAAPSGHRLGYVAFFTDTRLSEAERTLLERLFNAYGHAWQALQQHHERQRVLTHLKQHWRRYVLAAIILLMLPVRLYVLAPGQVTARDPVVVSAPMSGVIDKVEVTANSPVAAEDLLFLLEDTQLRNELAVSEKALSVARAEHMKNAQNAMFCDKCRSLLPELKAVMEREQAKVDWARSQLERASVRATVAGVVVFPGKSELEGRPVTVGERVMTIADPELTELTIRIPVDDAISIDEDTEVVFYLNVDPLKSFDAQIYQSSYEAVPQPDGTLAYVVRAHFTDESARLGLRGTAKVYGARSPILFHILRRPLSWLRRSLGL